MAEERLPSERGDCDHIIGISLANYPARGETDSLTMASEKTKPDIVFNYCPVCGSCLVDAAVVSQKDQPSQFKNCTPFRFGYFIGIA